MNHPKADLRKTGTVLGSVLHSGASCLLLRTNALTAARGDRDSDATLYIGDVGDDTVKTFDGKAGEFLGDLVTSGSGGLSSPMGLIFRGRKLALANQYFGFDNGEVLRFNRRTGERRSSTFDQ